jgi:hypothetical protein
VIKDTYVPLNFTISLKQNLFINIFHPFGFGHAWLTASKKAEQDLGLAGECQQFFLVRESLSCLNVIGLT